MPLLITISESVLSCRTAGPTKRQESVGGRHTLHSAALWLQASEGDLNEHFTTLSASAWSLGENLLAKLPLQFSFAPTATTRTGATIVAFFSYLVLTLATIYLWPWLKKYWQPLRPGLLSLEYRGRTLARPKNLEDSAPQTERGTEKREAFGRVRAA